MDVLLNHSDDFFVMEEVFNIKILPLMLRKIIFTILVIET